VTLTLPRLGHPWLIGLFAVLAAAAWWLRGPVDEEPAARPGPPGHVPEQYGRRLRTVEMDAQGRLARALEAPYAVRFVDDQSTELETPTLTVYKENEPPWVVRAERGRVSPEGDRVLLEGKVRVTRAAAPGIRAVQMDTANMTVLTKQDYAETGEPVTIVSEGSRVDAVGAQAWLGKEGRIKLLSKARGHYDIAPRR
jgi:lipopolysaccharide export system protein LptC